MCSPFAPFEFRIRSVDRILKIACGLSVAFCFEVRKRGSQSLDREGTCETWKDFGRIESEGFAT